MKVKSNKPSNTAFKQQRLRFWQPLLMPRVTIPILFIAALIFLPVGFGLYLFSSSTSEISFDYSNCDKLSSKFSPNNGVQMKFASETKTCTVQFTTNQDMHVPVNIYYRLTNFNQNNRRYVSSYFLDQLMGRTNGNEFADIAKCEPLGRVPVDPPTFITLPNGTRTKVSNDAVYYPCGLIANSLFSDEISTFTCIDSIVRGKACNNNDQTNIVNYSYKTDNIAWPGDHDKFVKSQWATYDPEQLPLKVVPPPFWREAFPKWKDGYTAENFPDISVMYRLHVWMRTSPLPTFRKLWGSNTENILPKGTWQVNIIMNFNVSRFDGTKSIVITNNSILGGKNFFLAFCYLVVGGILTVLAIFFLCLHIIRPRKMGDHNYLSFNAPPTRKNIETILKKRR